MRKEVSIVLSRERSSARKLAQEWYGLTDEQMKGCDVHHNPPVHRGGRNIPEHLYVYHNTLHSAVHGNDFTKWARKGAKLGGMKVHEKKDDLGRSIAGVEAAKRLHAEKDEQGRSLSALKPHVEKDEQGRSVTAMKAHREKNKEGKSTHAVKTGKKLNEKKDENGKSVNSVKGGKKGSAITNSQKYRDPEHPELGAHHVSTLKKLQRENGLPDGKENRERMQDG
jgi:hypothetical protein